MNAGHPASFFGRLLNTFDYQDHDFCRLAAISIEFFVGMAYKMMLMVVNGKEVTLAFWPEAHKEGLLWAIRSPSLRLLLSDLTWTPTAVVQLIAFSGSS